MIQQIDYKSRVLAYIINGEKLPNETTFLTPKECCQQVGYIVYAKGSEIKRHFHKPIERSLTETTEVLLIVKGKCIIDFYDDDKSFIGSQILCEGTVIVIVAGGHGFRMIEDTVIFEVKQGPYPGTSEKIQF